MARVSYGRCPLGEYLLGLYIKQMTECGVTKDIRMKKSKFLIFDKDRRLPIKSYSWLASGFRHSPIFQVKVFGKKSNSI
jgi:hypothetical protein